MKFLSKMKKYLYRVFVALSILLNALTGGRSYQNFSARNYEWRRKGQWNLVWFIDKCHEPWEDNHCLHCWINWRLCVVVLDKYGMNP